MIEAGIDERAIAERLEQVRERIEQACQRAGRASDDVTLIGVTKTFPMQAVVAGYEAGLRHFGENKVQELVSKEAEMPGVLHGGTVHWHMIGHLQRNKAKDVVAHADLFHALDSPRLARALEKRAAREERVIPCTVQVNISGEQSKFGLPPEEVPAFLDSLAGCEHLRIRGLMALAAPAEDPEQVRPQFRLLRSIFERYAASGDDRIEMDCLSMGMSGDFEVAIEEGATHVRIGSAIFGARSYAQ